MVTEFLKKITLRISNKISFVQYIFYIVFTTLFLGEYHSFLLVFLSLAIIMDQLVFGGKYVPGYTIPF